MKAAADVEVRPYAIDDEVRALECIVASLGGGPAGKRPPEFFRWKHYSNPFGRSFILLAEADDRIAGVRAFMRWRFRAGDREVTAVRAVDTATHPDFQGRGIFSRLTLTALDALRAEGVDLVFNTPNQNSLPGYLKMGWTTVGRVPVLVGVRRPLRFVRRFRNQTDVAGKGPEAEAPHAREILASDDIDTLLDNSQTRSSRLRTVRTGEYLRWRYADAPLLDYRAIREDLGDGTPVGLAIFRVRPRGALWETTLSELIVRPGDVRTAHRLIKRVRACARVDHVACHFTTGSAALSAARRSGFVRAPGGIVFVTNSLQNEMFLDPGAMDSWDLSAGDLEVF